MAHVEFDEATLTTAEERASIHEESQCRKYLVDSPGPAYGGSRGFPKSLATWRTMTGAHRAIRGAEQSQRNVAAEQSASPRFAMAPGDFVKRVLLAHSWLWEQMRLEAVRLSFGSNPVVAFMPALSPFLATWSLLGCCLIPGGA